MEIITAAVCHDVTRGRHYTVASQLHIDGSVQDCGNSIANALCIVATVLGEAIDRTETLRAFQAVWPQRPLCAY